MLKITGFGGLEELVNLTENKGKVTVVNSIGIGGIVEALVNLSGIEGIKDWWSILLELKE